MARAAPADAAQPTDAAAGGFELPPVIQNRRGQVRKAGFEFEYGGVSLWASATIVRHVFGGRVIQESTFSYAVKATRFGEFSVKIDSSILQNKEYEGPLRKLGLDPSRLDDAGALERFVLNVAATLVPIETVTPPIPITELGPLELLRQLLRRNGAEGTRASILYAFGLHINPEIPSEDPASILDHLRAFILLEPWLRKRVEVYISRRIAPYVKPFPAEYARLILADDYPAGDVGRLIDDYLEHNPTRNRSLDMLPVLAHLDRGRTMRRVVEKDMHLVKPRPAFHYRLPNCLVDEPDWTVAKEWNTWVEVERLAADKERLRRMAREHLRAE